jgi:hypothetical protein
MQPYTTTVYVDEKRRVLIDLPADVPIGEAEIKYEVITKSAPAQPMSRRDQMMARLAAEGLATPGVKYAPDDAVPLTDEERDRIWTKLAGGKTALELINEEREEASGDLQAEYRIRLIEAGHLSNAHTSPEAMEVSAAERRRLSGVLNGKLSFSQAILDDRDEDS